MIKTFTDLFQKCILGKLIVTLVLSEVKPSILIILDIPMIFLFAPSTH